MSIPPSSPYPQSIQEILNEGRRNAEAARNAPKPHPAQPMLDYHDQVARENNAYDYDPALTVQAQKQDSDPAGNASTEDEATDECPDVRAVYSFVAEHNQFSNKREAIAAAAPTLRYFHATTNLEHGVTIGQMSDDTYVLSEVYTSDRPDMICMHKVPTPSGSTRLAEAHSHGAESQGYKSQESSGGDYTRATSADFFGTSYFVPLDGPVYRIMRDRDAPAQLIAPQHYDHPDYVRDDENWVSQ